VGVADAGAVQEGPPAAALHNGRQFMPALQSLRGLAALWVVIYHLDVSLSGAQLPLLGISGIRVGWLGVDLFFVLSAYLLGQPFLEGRAPHYGKFLADRFRRIAPAYYAATGISVAVILFLFRSQWHPLPALATLVFVNNSTQDTLYAVNPVFWSLAVEMQFYLLLPFLARLFRGRHWPWALAGCVAVAVLFRGLTFAHGGPLGLLAGTFWLPAFMAHFGVGLAAARLRTVSSPFLASLAGVLLVGLPVALWIPQGSIGFGFESLAGQVLVRPLAAAGFALLVLAAGTPGRVRRALEVAPLKTLGDISYSLYLVHLPAQLVVRWAVGLPAHPTAFVLLGLAASLVYGAMLYGLVERPAELWRRRRRARTAATAPA
jgi:peptidoglycan/LPS O-acetylase OafA/YrhL